MKILKFLEVEYLAEKIVKHQDYIKGYINGIEVFSFDGISDFSHYELLDGQEYDQKELSEKERIEHLESVINNLLLGGN